MLIALAAFTAVSLIAVFLSPVHAITVLAGCVLLVFLPGPTVLAVLIASAVYLFLNLIQRSFLNGIRRLPRSRPSRRSRSRSARRGNWAGPR